MTSLCGCRSSDTGLAIKYLLLRYYYGRCPLPMPGDVPGAVPEPPRLLLVVPLVVVLTKVLALVL